LEPLLAPRQHLARVHALVAHGRDDDKLPVTWAERADAWLQRLGVPHALRLYPGGHGIGEAMARDFLDWTDALVANPREQPET
jgi:phospholipase/carboxylesterase